MGEGTLLMHYWAKVSFNKKIRVQLAKTDLLSSTTRPSPAVCSVCDPAESNWMKKSQNVPV